MGDAACYPDLPAGQHSLKEHVLKRVPWMGRHLEGQTQWYM